MKKHLLFLLAAGALVACSKSSDDAGLDGFSEGEGYVSLAINLPLTTGGITKAANDIFDDGTPNEYAVKDATLILFEGTSESTAKISSSYSLNLAFNLVGTTTDNITSTAKIVQKINDPLAAGNKFYALVILNNNGQLNIQTADNSLKVNGVSVQGKTLAEFVEDTKIALTGESKKTLLVGEGANAADFFMSNAPLFTAPGGSSDPAAVEGAKMQILSELDPSKIYETEELAASNPATEVFVERAVSKVTLNATAEGKTTGTNPSELPYKILGWQLDNTNNESYLVRDITGFDGWKSLKSNKEPAIANPYRFVGSDAVASGLFRSYWCVDPNYAPATDGEGVTYWDETTPGISWLAINDGIGYCGENTFDVAHQKDVNTTTVIVKVQFNNGQTFYTVNNDSKEFLTIDGITTFIKKFFISNTEIATALTPLLKAGRTFTGEDLVLEYTTGATTAGITYVKDITISGEALISGANLKASELVLGDGTTTALDKVNNMNTIRRYVDGLAYYPIHIKHFGDDLTPWRAGETPEPTAAEIYPNFSEANYLGRYGMVRNNWYNITVTAIKRLGIATVPTLRTYDPDDPNIKPEDDPEGPGNGKYDDDIDEYIAVKIHILSWAKRTQEVTL